MRILIDINLSPDWVAVLASKGVDAIHWSTVGDARASDVELMRYARHHDLVVFTHDLDFGTLLALTHAKGPSVIQVRTQNAVPIVLVDLVLRVLDGFSTQLESGALITIDEENARVRVLPVK
jgi:predicted nuclease of predicted toxin-antitoxin system